MKYNKINNSKLFVFNLALKKLGRIDKIRIPNPINFICDSLLILFNTI